MFNDTVDVAPPVKLRELITNGWIFPIDYPVVSNTASFDASKTLRAAIAYAVVQHYKDHRICSYDINYFTERLASRMYDKMSQHQYWIDQYIQLISDNQFFYNEEWQDGGTHTTETNGRTRTATNGRTTSSSNGNTSKSSDTPQNYIGDINNYLSSAQVDSGTENGTETGNENGSESGEGETHFTTDLHIKKSTLGDITVQFRNFATFPDFIKQITDAVAPCFIMYYGNEDV